MHFIEAISPSVDGSARAIERRKRTRLGGPPLNGRTMRMVADGIDARAIVIAFVDRRSS
jgi:hypothetical protein